jgi:hypothetical protein
MNIADKAKIVKVRDELKVLLRTTKSEVIKYGLRANIKTLTQLLEK